MQEPIQSQQMPVTQESYKDLRAGVHGKLKNQSSLKNIFKGKAQKVFQEPDYVYFAKNSPLCKFVCRSLILYLFLVAATSAMLSLNIYKCGLDAPVHTMRMRNSTYPVTQTGLTSSQSAPDTHDTYDADLQDVTSFFTPASYSRADAKLTQINTSVIAGQFPLALVLNYTASVNVSIQSLSFLQSDLLTSEDNGARLDIDVSNVKRTRVITNESWFNFDYWADNSTRFNYTSANGLAAGPRPMELCGQHMASQNWFNADQRDPASVIPLWFIDLGTLINAKPGCQDATYSMTVRLDKWFCFSPLLIRDVPKQTVYFENLTLTSEVIVDFNLDRVSGGTLGYSIRDSNIKRIWLTKHDANKEIYVYANNSIVTFYVPKIIGNQITFYGLSGRKNTNESANEIYQTSYKVKNTVTATTTIKITKLSTQTLTVNMPLFQLSYGDTIISFVFEDNTQSITVSEDATQTTVTVTIT
ncbi:Conserved_hypothetical protein [Hexamita inflata]|uniref:Uncharacterized protein n=1 Tax=Hexamita inflata TaxID=28002 RepID=A0AA86UFP3_9EUKA|nr:Conserved hypothetical protein [Hexamita inflata]